MEATALYDFTAMSEGELSFKSGDQLIVKIFEIKHINNFIFS